MPDGSVLARMAFPFMPADPARHGSLVEAGPGWALELPASASGLDVVVWGRAPDTAASSTGAVRSAVARERALRRLPVGFRPGFGSERSIGCRPAGCPPGSGGTFARPSVPGPSSSFSPVRPSSACSTLR